MRFVSGYPRLTDFRFDVIHSDGSGVVCAYYRDTVPRGANVTLTCGYGIIGQFIHFIRLGGPGIHHVSLCEVQVTGSKLGKI